LNLFQFNPSIETPWWREVARIRDGVGVVEGVWSDGVWIEECISKKVGNRMDIFFWTDQWLEGIPCLCGLGGYSTCL